LSVRNLWNTDYELTEPECSGSLNFKQNFPDYSCTLFLI